MAITVLPRISRSSWVWIAASAADLRPGELLAARTRDGAAPVAPPHGLTLEEVTYPADDELAAQAERARTTRRLSC